MNAVTFANMYGSILMLAQDGAMPLGGAGGGDAGTAGGGTGGTTAPPAMLDSFLPMVLLFVVVIIVFTWISQRKERKRRESMLTSIRKHDTVQTIGGMVGSIVEVKDDKVVLKVDESSNTRITFARSAIQQVLASKGDKRTKEAEQPELAETAGT